MPGRFTLCCMELEPMGSATPPRIGMHGGGFMARTHTHAARIAGAQLEALASSGPEQSEAAARTLGYRSARTPEELLASALPIVHVCTPNDTHAAYSLAA